MESNGSMVLCPRSGALFKALVTSLQLHLPAVGGPAANFLRDRTARRYYAGGDVSEDARRALCLSAVNAAEYAGYLDGFELPGMESAAPPHNTYLAGVLFDGLGTWEAYAAAAPARGELSRDAAFAVARLAALHFGVHLAALMNLCGAGEGARGNDVGDDRIAVAPGKTPLCSLLKYLQDPTIARLPQLELDTESDPEHPVGRLVIPEPKPQLEPEQLADELRLDETTVKKWGREEHLPDLRSVGRLIDRFTKTEAQAAKLRRWLLLQLALIHVTRLLTRALGPVHAREVAAAFVEVACLPRDFLHQYGRTRQEFLASQRDMLERGAASPAGQRALHFFELGMPLMDVPPAPLKPERWLDDVRAVREGTVKDRLVEVFG